MKIVQKFVDWCKDPSERARIERTITQGIIAIAIGLLSTVVEGAPTWFSVSLVPVVMVILTTIQAELGKANAVAEIEEPEEEQEDD